MSVASEGVKAAPRLIPVFGHRMMPAEPHQTENPVFSIHQADIICYGFDLADYLRREFNLEGRRRGRRRFVRSVSGAPVLSERILE